MRILTEQEKFWQGEFGNEYIKRNRNAEILAGKIALFRDILRNIKISNCLELGSNIGLNLSAIRTLIPSVDLSAVEINEKAVQELRQMDNIEVFHESIIDFDSNKKWDLTFTAGVMIHINPNMLSRVYEALYHNSNRYILVAEYYNPTPIEVEYRGFEGKLFKRDFAGELLDKYSDLKVIDYGFTYHRDNLFLYDDVNWFLLEKK